MISEGYKKNTPCKRKALGDDIDKGRYSKEKNSKAFDYFYNYPPYKHTQLQPKSWGSSDKKGDVS